MILVELDKVLEVFGNIHPLDHNANAYRSKIEKLTCYNLPKGKWLSNSRGIKAQCSNCGATPITEIKENKSNASLVINWCANQKFSEVFKYCPTCGAMMEG